MSSIESVSPKQAIQRLADGNRRYVSGDLDRPHASVERRSQLTDSQAPFAAVVSCADSRVVPELIFDQGIGDIFVLRVAGNIASTDVIASVEYAVAHLGTALIAVMGHQSCGAVKAARNSEDLGYNLNHLVAGIRPAVSMSSDLDTVIRENANINAGQFITRSTIIADAFEANKVEIVSAYYSLATGKVAFLKAIGDKSLVSSQS